MKTKLVDQTQETAALIKTLTLGDRQVEEGKVQSVASVFQRLRERGTKGKIATP